MAGLWQVQFKNGERNHLIESAEWFIEEAQNRNR